MPIKPKKSLGQNFLKDEAVLARIISVAEIQPGDRVLEIGPGMGALTQALAAAGAEVLAIELDHALVERLKQAFAQLPQVTIHEGNILDMHVDALLQDAGFTHRNYQVVANIPYYITAPIIRSLLSLRIQPEQITLMVQAEVADRLVAPAGGTSILSVMAQYYAEVTKEFVVPAEAFDPVPEVMSAVVTLRPKRVFDVERDRQLFRLVRGAFAARRKTLANNLANTLHISRTEAEAKLAGVGLGPLVRAQEVTVDQWVALREVM